jgi:hypothetical protein
MPKDEKFSIRRPYHEYRENTYLGYGINQQYRTKKIYELNENYKEGTKI